ncbi:MAG: hypothetical protein R2848_01940 [Thermomicrobiales bacterium]
MNLEHVPGVACACPAPDQRVLAAQIAGDGNIDLDKAYLPPPGSPMNE